MDQLLQEVNGELNTYLYEPGNFTPLAKFTPTRDLSVVADHLGTPAALYDGEGRKVWENRTDIYGRPLWTDGLALDMCFRYPGQYEDNETGLSYNRFRYYDAGEGVYISRDPIGLAGGNPTLYGYVGDVNGEVDPAGLMKFFHGTTKEAAKAIKTNGVELSKNRHDLDFNSSNSGAFYTHDNLRDTEKYNRRFKGRETAVVQFDIPDDQLAKLKVKTFNEPSTEWGEFVTKSRTGSANHSYDLVVGPKLANPFEVIQGLEEPKAIKNQIQYAFTSEKGAKLLSKNTCPG